MEIKIRGIKRNNTEEDVSFLISSEFDAVFLDIEDKKNNVFENFAIPISEAYKLIDAIGIVLKNNKRAFEIDFEEKLVMIKNEFRNVLTGLER